MLNKLSSENNVLATMILHLNMYLVFFLRGHWTVQSHSQAYTYVSRHGLHGRYIVLHFMMEVDSEWETGGEGGGLLLLWTL